MDAAENDPLLPGLRNPVEDDDDDDDVQLSKCGATAGCDPRQPMHRYLVLIVMCFLSFGSYFCYDNPAALQDNMERDMDLSTGQFMLFYSLYSWPNVILCFFGGFLIDKVLGVRWGAIIFSLFVTGGQVLFALGALVNKYWLMAMGRFVFGLGGESLCVAQNTYAVSWFKGRELNMVFGLQLSFSRVGSTVNMVTMQPLYDWIDSQVVKPGHFVLGISLFIAGTFCVFSLFCAIGMWFLDRRASRVLKKNKANTGETIRLRDVKDFAAPVWLLCIICVAYYVAIFPFIGLGLVFFEMKWNYEPKMASACNSLVYILSAVASPIFGFCIDKIGRNVFWVIAGVTITLACHAAMAFTFINPFIPMVIMGLAYSVLASALWPMVALIVKQNQLGTAYGIMQSVQNLGLAVVTLVAGLIVDDRGYLVLEVFFLVWLCVALAASVALYLVDAARGGMLNRSAYQRKKQALKAEASEKEVNAEESDE